ncbi:MAG: DNA translocase FtsK 4TM domain-containing protein [Pelolinea sp.]|nr:DNA translocase FtsK 4TM domain-containing protein [Pelolinea sp.]
MAKRKSASRSGRTSSYSKSKRDTSALTRLNRKVRKLSPERKMDILGVFLLILGVVSLLGFLGITKGGLTDGIVQFLSLIAGMGALVFPIVLMLVGLWFIVRNEQRFPIVSVERLLGIVFLYINILAWMHWFSGGGWELAANGDGGGYLGAFFERLLVNLLGVSGALVALIAWLLVALAFTFDLSIPDLFRKVGKPAVKTGEFIAEKSSQIAAPVLKKKPLPEQEKERIVFANGDGQPDGFTPIKSGARQLTRAEKLRSRLEPVKTEAKLADSKSGTEITRSYQSAENMVAWTLPLPEEILNPATKAVIRKNVDENRARVIEETLASFSAPAHVVEIHRGPTFTQYGVEPDFVETRAGKTRVRVNKIVSLVDDLALALAAPSIRIQAPVPGRRYIGIEVPNSEAELVSLKEGMESKAFSGMNAFLKFVLGKDVAGKPAAVDLAKMPHLLIAGTTGSGKSVCINSILCSLLMQCTPNELRLVMVDPKRVELTGYNGIPHLLTPVIVNHEKVVGTLQWMSREMESRYKKFAEVGARNIDDYNARHADKLPYIVVVIDELADLMMLAPEETERNLNRLAQLARATGIHVIIATQRPSVDVITGIIKANFPARISFSVASGMDSRVVLDQVGAERLIGRGDMLFQAPDAPSPKRLQGVFVANDEIQRLVQFWKNQVQQIVAKDPTMRDRLPQKVYPSATLTQTPLFDEAPGIGEDEYLNKAIDIVRKEERASISLLQRKLRIGYTRAARLVDRLEELEIIGETESGSGVRPVLDFGDEEPEEGE